MAIKALEKALPTLQAMEDLKGHVRIGKAGGRSFRVTEGSKETFKFKDLLQHAKALGEKELAAASENPAKEVIQERIRQVANVLTQLDFLGDFELSTKSLWIRFLTAIRRFFGNLGRDSHSANLNKIFNQTFPAAQALSSDAKAFYEGCRDYVQKNKSILPKLKQLALDEAKNPAKEVKLSPQEEAAQQELEKDVAALRKLPSLADRVKVIEKMHKLHIFTSLLAAELHQIEQDEEEATKTKTVGNACGLPLLYKDQLVREIALEKLVGRKKDKAKKAEKPD